MTTSGPIEVLVLSTDPSADPFAVTEVSFAASAQRYPDYDARFVTRFHASGALGVDRLARAQIILGIATPIENLASRAPHLRWTHVVGAGVDRLLPLDWLPRRVRFTNSSGAHASKIEEFALMTFLMLNNNIALHMTNQRRGVWRDRYSSAVAGKTALVIGLGALGGAAARAAKTLGMRVIGVRRTERPFRYADSVVGQNDLPSVLPLADFVFVATPLTPATRGLIGARELALMKTGAGLVNVGRAGLVDYTALARRLEDGALGGAILDVFEREPLPPDDPLWATRNLIVLPHVSATDEDRYLELVLDTFFENALRFAAGRRLTNLVSREHGY